MNNKTKILKKAWSIGTTVREAKRILPFLKALKAIEGENFDENGQVKYQTLLIQNRLYKPTKLTKKLEKYYETASDKMKFEEAQEIFEFMKSNSNELKKSLGLRGRTSVATLTKMGLAIAKKSKGKVIITSLGNGLLENKDLGETFFKSFLKWQIPNPESNDYKLSDGYNIKPFIAVLHLIDLVNKKSLKAGQKEKGISKEEFALFAPTLINYKNIQRYADQIIALRNKLKDQSKEQQKKIFDNYKKEFAEKFLQNKETAKINKLLKNLKDYGDNAIRYFRLTRYIYIRGNGFYVDLEPQRKIEIDSLLKADNGKSIEFENKEQYLDYISDVEKPVLAWEAKEKLIDIVNKITNKVKEYEQTLSLENKKIPSLENLKKADLKKLIENLRIYRRELQEKENHKIAGKIEKIKNYIEKLQNIRKEDNKPIALEKYATLGLHALNDALKIQPNYPVGDDNQPTFTAPAGKPDIECYYKSFNAICEVTMLTGRNQWYNEGQPVMRHLRDFEDQNNGKDNYCLFIAPSLHRDTVNTFWTSVKYEYEGRSQKIIPLQIKDFIRLLQIVIVIKEQNKFLTHLQLASLYNNIIAFSKNAESVKIWINAIPNIIESWQENLIN